MLLRFSACLLSIPLAITAFASASEPESSERFQKEIKPILTQFCVGCHNTELKKGGIAFDQIDADAAKLENRALWWKTLRMVRAGIMPPKNKPHPEVKQIEQIVSWIKTSAFKIDPLDPDPGRVTVRRLNRTEYRNTIRELLGVNFDTNAEFPPDDTGHGFDNIGDVLTMSPLLLEKYVAAARAIVGQAIPSAPKVVAEKRLNGRSFHLAGEAAASSGTGDSLVLSYYKPASASAVSKAVYAGRYQVVLDLSANEKYVDGVFDYNKCRLLFKVDGQTLLDQEFTRQGGRPFHYEFPQEWAAGDHALAMELVPLTPKEKQVRNLTLRVVAATVRGPLEEKYWVPPANYKRHFPEAVPTGLAERDAYARRLLQRFAERAYRRPVDEATVIRLAKLAESIYTRPGRTFEAGIAQAMTVVLASPRFLFREEDSKPGASGPHPLLDEYSLASRLSYFLWSSMPDDQLFHLAGANKLRENLQPQLARMLADPRSGEFVRNFTGQWLQARDIQTVPINARAVISRDEAADPKAQQRQARFRQLNSKPPASLTEAEKKELAEVPLTLLWRLPPFRPVRARRRPASSHASGNGAALRVYSEERLEPRGAARQRLHILE